MRQIIPKTNCLTAYLVASLLMGGILFPINSTWDLKRCAWAQNDDDAPVASTNQVYRVGDRPEVEWKGTWYRAEIIEVKGGSYKIRYDGYNSAWDEWVQPARMRGIAKAPSKPVIKPVLKKPTPRKPATAPVKTRPGAAVTNPKTASLKPKRGYIAGRAVFANGKPVPRFRASALGWASEIHLGPSGTIPSLGQVEGSNGYYAFRPTSAYDRKKILSEALVSVVRAEARLSYKNRKFLLGMHPLDGKRDGDSKGGFRGYTSKGVVRNFALKLHGPRIGFEKKPPPRDTDSNEVSDPSFGAFYGGVAAFTFSPDDGRNPDSGPFKNAVMTLTFTPNGSLLDGSASRTVVRTLRIKEDSVIKYFPGYFRDIPLGDYTLTAMLNKADGTSYPIRMRKLGGEYESSFAVQFTPWDTIAHVETVTVLATR